MTIDTHKIFKLESPEEWLNTCWLMIQDIFDHELYNCLFNTESIHDLLFENQSTIIEIFAKEFCANFSYIKAYHATRTTNPKTYSQEGIKPLNVSTSNEIIINFFKENNFLPPLHEEQLINTINQFNIDENDETRENLVYFQLYKNALLTHSTQYLLYGSERVLSIVNSIPPYNYGKILKNIGTPIIFHVAVPCQEIVNINSILLEILSLTANYFIHEEPPFKHDLSIIISNTLLPNFILSLEYPDVRNLYDPFK